MCELLPVAEHYARIQEAGRVYERALLLPQRMPSELELQARWFAGDFGKQFRTLTNDPLEIVQFGTWNREAGPDFSDAVIRINGNEPTRGSIEFDLTDRNWELHGHATNPAFENTVLHVFVHASERQFFTRTMSHRNVPQLRVNPSELPESFSANIPLARPGRCQAPLQHLPEQQVRNILDAAAQLRLQRKANRLRRLIDAHGRDAALFQEIAGALGYKQNKLPFTLLAQRLPLKFLREKVTHAEALLFGTAGFLEASDLAAYPLETRNYLRELWDRWWPHRDKMRRLVLPLKLWRINGGRPLNHPQRRLAALALIARHWFAFLKSLGTNNSTAAQKFFLRLDHPFWNRHYTFDADPAPKPIALVGDSRVADILANVVFPFFLAEENDIWAEYEKLTAQFSNRRIETGGTRLFGSDPRRRFFLKTVARQQGLLQIYEDFCLRDNSDCAQCPFPEQMSKWR